MNFTPVHIAKALLQSASIPHVRLHSRLNHHAVGMDYLCLFRDERLTVKLYIIAPGRLETCGTHDFLVNPHNHNYAFDTVVLRGKVKNVEFTEETGADAEYYRVHEYFPDEKRVRWTGGTCLRRNTYTYLRGMSYHLKPSDIHTLIIDPTYGATLLLFQYADVGKTAHLFTPKGTEPKFDERLYRRPNHKEIQELLGRAREALSEWP